MNPYLGYHMGGAGILTVILLAVWTIFWKIAAVWTAAKNDQKKWFVALLIINTFGILEIVYIFHVAKKKWADVTNFYASFKN